MPSKYPEKVKKGPKKQDQRAVVHPLELLTSLNRQVVDRKCSKDVHLFKNSCRARVVDSALGLGRPGPLNLGPTLLAGR
jgi:hypothetical protein